MDNDEFGALISSIKNGEFGKVHTLFSQCKMIWPNQLPSLLQVINTSNLRTADYALYYRLRAFEEIYSDALNGKLQCNDYYLHSFKPK